MGVATQATIRVVVTTLSWLPRAYPSSWNLRLCQVPDWYAPLERYISYGVDQVERAVEGIRRLKHRMDDFEHVQTEMQASIDS
jgi:hypothetical protein